MQERIRAIEGINCIGDFDCHTEEYEVSVMNYTGNLTEFFFTNEFFFEEWEEVIDYLMNEFKDETIMYVSTDY